MAVEKLDIFASPIAASRIALERSLDEFQQLCDHVPCRTIKRKLKKNIDKIELSFAGLAAPALAAAADGTSTTSAAAAAKAVSPKDCIRIEKKAKTRK